MDAADGGVGQERGGYERGRPLFLFVHLWDVHYDYAAPPEYVRRFDPDYQGQLDARDFEKNEALHAGMPARDLEHLIALYDAEIRFTDDVLGRMLAALGERGMLEDALLVFTADHGEEFFEHGDKGHGHTLFDEVVRVPLIFHWPGHFEAGGVVTDQVCLVDLMPTLLALAGSARPSREQGRDVSPLLRGVALASEPALCEVQMGRPRLRALRTSEYKLIEPLGDGGPAYAFDLALDPDERCPLEPDGDPWRARLETLERLQDAVEARPGPRARAAELSDELRRRLGDLGYADDE
jgi:arylsulfatase A-like enzyme